jgi:hypothetical protein
MSAPQGLQLLLSDRRGVHIPRRFALEFNLPAFGIAEDDEDIATLRAGPDHEWYWEAWDAVIDKAKTAEGGYLHQDGDLWLVHPHLMEEQEYIDFFGENPPVPDGWTDYAACRDCCLYIANADLSALDDKGAAHIENMCNALSGYAVVTSITLGFQYDDCEICGALAGDRYRVLVKDDNQQESV